MVLKPGREHVASRGGGQLCGDAACGGVRSDPVEPVVGSCCRPIATRLLSGVYQSVGSGPADARAILREHPMKTCSYDFLFNHFEPEADSFLTLAS